MFSRSLRNQKKFIFLYFKKNVKSFSFSILVFFSLFVFLIFCFVLLSVRFAVHRWSFVFFFFLINVTWLRINGSDSSVGRAKWDRLCSCALIQDFQFCLKCGTSAGYCQPVRFYICYFIYLLSIMKNTSGKVEWVHRPQTSAKAAHFCQRDLGSFISFGFERSRVGPPGAPYKRCVKCTIICTSYLPCLTLGYKGSYQHRWRWTPSGMKYKWLAWTVRTCLAIE